MKAALEAWSAASNLFHQGVAKESDDPDVVAATMAKPGVVLRRPVGSDGPSGSMPTCPLHLSDDEPKRGPKRSRGKKETAPGKERRQDSRKSALAYEREERRRGAERRREEAARQKERERRRHALSKAQAAFDKTKREHDKREHDKRAAAIEAERGALERRARVEEEHWEKQKEKLEAGHATEGARLEHVSAISPAGDHLE